LKVEEKVYYFENKHNFLSSFGVRVETNIPKNLRAIVMLALCPGRCLLHDKGIENDQTIFPHHSGKGEVCSESMTKFSFIKFFIRNATIWR